MTALSPNKTTWSSNSRLRLPHPAFSDAVLPRAPRRPGTSTSADITMVLSGATTSGTATIDGTSTGINNDPPCTQNTHFVATYTATATTITFSGTSGTFDQMGCTNSSDNKPMMPLPMTNITNTLASFNGTYTVSAITLTIMSGSTTTTFNRR